MQAQKRTTTSRPSYSNGIGGIEMKTPFVRRATSASRSADSHTLVAIRKRGHTVEGVHQVPPNAGEYEFIVDGNFLNLEETRRLLEIEEEK